MTIEIKTVKFEELQLTVLNRSEHDAVAFEAWKNTLSANEIRRLETFRWDGLTRFYTYPCPLRYLTPEESKIPNLMVKGQIYFVPKNHSDTMQEKSFWLWILK